MEWSRLKNIILFILAITNLCLLVFVAGQQIEKGNDQRRARSNAIALLTDRGITVDQLQVPESILLIPQITERNLEQESALAMRLLGGGVRVEARGGEVYRYFNQNGSIQFHNDGAFFATFAPDTFPVGKDAEEACLKLLKALDFEAELIQQDEAGLVFRQTWQGWPLFTRQVMVELKNGCVTALSAGRRLVGEPAEDAARKTVTISTALIAFLNGVNALGDVCSRVDVIVQGYTVSTALSGPMILTPVWYIVTDTGAYQLDLVTGGLTRGA